MSKNVKVSASKKRFANWRKFVTGATEYKFPSSLPWLGQLSGSQTYFSRQPASQFVLCIYIPRKGGRKLNFAHVCTTAWGGRLSKRFCKQISGGPLALLGQHGSCSTGPNSQCNSQKKMFTKPFTQPAAPRCTWNVLPIPDPHPYSSFLVYIPVQK